MASPPTSRIGFFDLSGGSIASPLEWKSALIELDAPLDDWRSIKLSIQGASASVRVEHRFGRDRLLADWPLSGTGNHRVTLHIGSYAETRVVTIRPHKINDTAYALMIDDLQRRLPTSIAIGLQKAGAFSGLHLLPPEEGTLAQELVRLRRAIDGVDGVRPGLAAVLRELAYDHYAVFRSYEPWVDRRTVRRPSPAGLVRALVRGHNLDDAGELIQVVDRRTEQTVDVYENRLVKLFAQQTRSRLHAVLAEARRRSDPGFLHEAMSLRGRLDRACQLASFLDQVSMPAFLPLRLSMVLMNRDPYPAALEGFLEFSRGLAVRLDGEAKYKLDSEVSDASDAGAHPKKDDIDKMHAYRDAIRDASGKRVVALASILYPGPTIRYGDGIAALKAVPGEADELSRCVGDILAAVIDGAAPRAPNKSV